MQFITLGIFILARLRVERTGAAVSLRSSSVCHCYADRASPLRTSMSSLLIKVISPDGVPVRYKRPVYSHHHVTNVLTH